MLVQKLDAVLKVVYGTQDSNVARGGLYQLSGFASPGDMPADKIKQLGNILNMVARKQAKLEGNRVIRLPDNQVIWQGPPPVQQPQQQEAMF